MASRKRCLCGVCGDKPYVRGLGEACYQSAARRVRAGETTWDDLVAAGLALAAQKKSGRRSRPISEKIDALLTRSRVGI